MKTKIRSKRDRTLKLAVSGDDCPSVFVLNSSSQASPSGKGSGTSSYGINTWVQSFHPLERVEKGKFYTVLSQGGSDTPVFAESVWTDVMPRADDPPPPNLNGQDGRMAG